LGGETGWEISSHSQVLWSFLGGWVRRGAQIGGVRLLMLEERDPGEAFINKNGVGDGMADGLLLKKGGGKNANPDNAFKEKG